MMLFASCKSDQKTVIEHTPIETVISKPKKDGDLLTEKYWFSPTNFVDVPQWRYFNTEGMYKGWIEGRGEPVKFTGSYKLVNEGKSLEIYNMGENHGTETYDIVKLTNDTLTVKPAGDNDVSITFIYVEK
ncbi:MAG: hypothetical protein KDD32_03985 [Bacteroidetes bacterium]|nr:hypothetical protein [Bacteroidota bacterium]